MNTFKVIKEKKICQPKIQYPTKLSFRKEHEIKKFPDKQKLREIFDRRQGVRGNFVFNTKAILQA